MACARAAPAAPPTWSASSACWTTSSSTPTHVDTSPENTLHVRVPLATSVPGLLTYLSWALRGGLNRSHSTALALVGSFTGCSITTLSKLSQGRRIQSSARGNRLDRR